MSALLAALERRALEKPTDIVLVSEAGSISAKSLWQHIDTLSCHLQAHQVQCLGLYAENSPAWIIADLACQQAGIAVVPIPTFFTQAQQQHLLTSAAMSHVLASCELAAMMQKTLLAIGSEANADKEPETGLLLFSLKQAAPILIPADTAKITFTSGSTGAPKGVCLSTQQCLAVANSLVQVLNIKHPKHLCLLPLSTLLENVAGVYWSLLAGGSVVVLSGDQLGMQGSSQMNRSQFIRSIDIHQPNSLILVPQMLAVLDEALQSGWQAPPSLQFVAVGGARVSPQILARVRSLGLPVYEGYGLSECASVVALNVPGDDCLGSSGKLLPHVDVTCRDNQLIVSGNSFLGYLDQPQSWGLTTVDTGDIGTIDDDGFVSILGRSNNRLISSFGRNICPEWVESELLAEPMFQQLMVVGDGRPCCGALLFTRSPAVSDTEIQQAVDRVNQRLPDYAQIGHWLRLHQPFTAANGLLTDNGKLRRQPILDDYAAAIDQLYQPPTTTPPPEELLA